MKKQLSIINWSVLFIAVISFILTLAGLRRDCPALYNSGFIIVFIALIWNVGILIFYVIKKKDRKRIIYSILSVLFLGLCILSMMILYLISPLKDDFAKNLIIPEDIPLSYPIIHNRDATLFPGIGENDLFLFEGKQPGMYKYDLYVNQIPKGVVYLKAFEITRDIRLSKRSLREESGIEVHNPTDTVLRFRHPGHFTIHEGDWGQPYAARFEVWFVPENGEPEYKLMEKNFVIEGWQR